MTPSQIMYAIVTVIAVSVGQLLFKRAGMEVQAVGAWLDLKVLALVGVAAIIYSAATFLWITLLRQVPLNKAYLFMALSFVIVPVISHFVFSEQMTLGFLAGAVIVVLGLFVATQFG